MQMYVFPLSSIYVFKCVGDCVLMQAWKGVFMTFFRIICFLTVAPALALCPYTASNCCTLTLTSASFRAHASWSGTVNDVIEFLQRLVFEDCERKQQHFNHLISRADPSLLFCCLFVFVRATIVCDFWCSVPVGRFNEQSKSPLCCLKNAPAGTA